MTFRRPRWQEQAWRSGFKLCMAAAFCLSLAWLSQAQAQTPDVPQRWQAAYPHQGSVATLSEWWQAFGEPALPEMMAAAQQASPSLAQAATRLAQAQQLRVAAGAAMSPQVNATASAQRGRVDLSSGLVNTAQAGAQFSWEWDLFGGQSAARQAALARQDGAEALWHEARVSVAADVANSVLSLRACEVAEAWALAEAKSREASLRLAQQLRQAGLESEAQAAQWRASQAQAAAQWQAQQAQCARELKALVALTAWSEDRLKAALQARHGQLPEPAGLALTELPAQVLQQRPDVQAAERQLEAAVADVRQAQAARWPRISLSGSIGGLQVGVQGQSQSGSVWSVGPVQVSLPLWDGGQRQARTEAAEVALTEARTSYNAVLRVVVQEVEQALVSLGAADQRRQQARQALDGARTVLDSTETLERHGLASRLGVEEARRSWLQAQSLSLASHQEQVAAWIALYRAVGGGWSPATQTAAR